LPSRSARPAKIAHGGNLVSSGNLSKSVENPAHFPKVEYLAKPFVIDSAITGGEDGHLRGLSLASMTTIRAQTIAHPTPHAVIQSCVSLNTAPKAENPAMKVKNTLI
jgi:hypothetical protein